MDFESVALIVIDMQCGMLREVAGDRNNFDAENNILKLLSSFRSRNWPVVMVRHISRTPGSPFWPGQKGVEFQPDFVPFAREHVVEKNVPDAFIHSNLERWLLNRSVRQVVIVGVSTSNSVESTARTCGNLGFETIVVSDATFTFAKKDFAGVWRSASEVHAMSLANLEGEYARILTTKKVLDEWFN